jgi:Xaa-Pro aminopeptidase
MGLAYENISAAGANAALPHYSPLKRDCLLIDTDTPYLNDSGGQYLDGTCDTTRTVHLGRPTQEQAEAFTRVLQGHIAIDSAVFPNKTTGKQLDVLARRALWQDGLNYLHGTGHGIGSYLNVHEGVHSFSNDVPLQPGHVITNEPGFCASFSLSRPPFRLLALQVHVLTRPARRQDGPLWCAHRERARCTRRQDQARVQRPGLAWLRAPDVRADTDEDGRGEYAVA